MKKILYGFGAIAIFGIGWGSAAILFPAEQIHHVIKSEAANTTTSTTTTQSSESSEETTETSIQPSAQIPQWYQDAEDTVSNYEARRQDAMSRDTTFNIGGVADEVRMAMEILEANEDEDSAAYDMQNILIFKGYDNEQMRVDLMNRASSLAEVSE